MSFLEVSAMTFLEVLVLKCLKAVAMMLLEPFALSLSEALLSPSGEDTRAGRTRGSWWIPPIVLPGFLLDHFSRGQE